MEKYLVIMWWWWCYCNLISAEKLERNQKTLNGFEILLQWITETHRPCCHLDTTKIHGSEVSMRCCTSSGLCFSRWVWVEYWKAFWSSGCVVYGYEMPWNAINPPCFAGYLRGIYFGCRFITSKNHIYHISMRALGGSIPHSPTKGLSSSGFFLPTVFHGLLDQRESRRKSDDLPGRS